MWMLLCNCAQVLTFENKASKLIIVKKLFWGHDGMGYIAEYLL